MNRPDLAKVTIHVLVLDYQMSKAHANGTLCPVAGRAVYRRPLLSDVLIHVFPARYPFVTAQAEGVALCPHRIVLREAIPGSGAQEESCCNVVQSSLVNRGSRLAY